MALLTQGLTMAVAPTVMSKDQPEDALRRSLARDAMHSPLV